MKKVIAFVLLTVVLAVCFAGCKQKVSDGRYYLYQYDSTTYDFVKTNVYVEFSEGMTAFKYSVGDAYGIYGKVVENEGGYSISATDDVANALLGIEDLKESDPELYEKMKENFSSFTITQEFCIAEKRLFSSYNVELMKDVTSSNLSSVEGVYEVVDSDEIKYRFSNGFMYEIDIDDKGKETESRDPSARYVLQDGIITIIRIDKDGKDIVYEGKTQRLKYLFATMSFPEEYAEMSFGDDEYSEQLKTNFGEIAGKTIAVMSSAFYAK